MKRYTFFETQYIREHYKRHSDAVAIAAHLGRCIHALRVKISKMGIAIPNKIGFSNLEIKFLRDNYLTLSNRHLADRLGKKKTVTRNMMRELGLTRKKEKPWTHQEDEILLHNYRTKGNIEIAGYINRTEGGIIKRMRTLKIKRTPAELAALNELKMRKFLSHCFKPGHTGHKIDHAKAWATRRMRDAAHEQIIQRIQQREKSFHSPNPNSHG